MTEKPKINKDTAALNTGMEKGGKISHVIRSPKNEESGLFCYISSHIIMLLLKLTCMKYQLKLKLFYYVGTILSFASASVLINLVFIF